MKKQASKQNSILYQSSNFFFFFFSPQNACAHSVATFAGSLCSLCKSKPVFPEKMLPNNFKALLLLASSMLGVAECKEQRTGTEWPDPIIGIKESKVTLVQENSVSLASILMPEICVNIKVPRTTRFFLRSSSL